MLPGRGAAAWHDGGAGERALLPPGDTCSDEEKALSFQLLGAAVAVGEVGVAAVDDDVARREERHHLGDEGIDDLASLDHQHDLAGCLEVLAELLDGLGADELLAGAPPVDERVDLGGGPVEDRHREAPALDVEHQVLPHDRQADQPDVRRHDSAISYASDSLLPRGVPFAPSLRLIPPGEKQQSQRERRADPSLLALSLTPDAAADRACA
mmetsp:Transcript_17377/g.34075  ORF Transcript_17377/g.34075 Transcript_17377/m.34075 type:complete len:211 (+) Transcript_17377:1347-1979(+)